MSGRQGQQRTAAIGKDPHEGRTWGLKAKSRISHMCYRIITQILKMQ